MSDEAPANYEPKAATLRDALARRAFNDWMVRTYPRRSDELGAMWASTAYDDIKSMCFVLADDFLDTAQRWVDRTSDGKLSTARTLRLLWK